MSGGMHLSPDALQLVLGTMMAGTWANTILFACELYFLYLRLFLGSSESLWIQLGLIATGLVDGAATASGYAVVWRGCVGGWGDLESLDPARGDLGRAVSILLSAISPLAFHAFQIKHMRSIVPKRFALPLTIALAPAAVFPLAAVLTAWVLSVTRDSLSSWAM